MTDCWLKNAPPEELDDTCHCGKYPEGTMVWGTRCPIIEHRARSGKQWRDAYIELEREWRRDAKSSYDYGNGRTG
jgi:hypothetical protein